ncbi:hypothetical protein CI1B_83460 [Bradyrhizobium ivorense]|uniref:Uncharacterized protein n=1 Tax=Bradyrhizobium ivorense TaxID=2511166 RepID=A0A508U025_9BRAD|nr:hypothetical protein CI1B_83460 [Bradyrhizobium ivorense]
MDCFRLRQGYGEQVASLAMTWMEPRKNSITVILRCEPLRRASKDRRPPAGPCILRGSPSGASAPQGSHLQRQRRRLLRGDDGFGSGALSLHRVTGCGRGGAIHLAPLAGRGRIASSDAIRVRGSFRESAVTAFAEAAPHPDPLPVKNGERGKREKRLTSPSGNRRPRAARTRRHRPCWDRGSRRTANCCRCRR